MAVYHTPSEELAIRSLDSKTLAKRNNVLCNGGMIFETPEKKGKFDEEYQIIRSELFSRGILSDAHDKRLIHGNEII